MYTTCLLKLQDHQCMVPKNRYQAQQLGELIYSLDVTGISFNPTEKPVLRLMHLPWPKAVSKDNIKSKQMGQRIALQWPMAN